LLQGGYPAISQEGISYPKLRSLGGGYKPKVRKYFGDHLQLRYRSKPRYSSIPKPRNSSPYAPARPWNELMQYKPRDRFVYDLEIKRILKNIEQKLSSEPDAEETLRQLESSPELFDEIYERLMEKLSEGLYEKPEVDEPEEDLSEELERKNAEQSFEPKEELGEIESLEPEPKDVEENFEKSSGEAESSEKLVQDEEVESEAVEPELPEEVSEPSIDVESSPEVIEHVEAQDLSSLEQGLYEEPIKEIVEPQTDFSPPEPSNEVIEQLETQDLSPLEAELYQEPIENLSLKLRI